MYRNIQMLKFAWPLLLWQGVLLGVPVLATGQSREGFTLSGNIKGVTGKIYLTLMEGRIPHRIDSTRVVNGHFEFKGAVETPILAKVEASRCRHIPPFFLENNNMLIYGNIQEPAQITVYGSVNQTRYSEFQKTIAAVFRTNSPAMFNREVNRITINFVDNNPDCVAAAYVLYKDLALTMPPSVLQQKINNFTSGVRASVYVVKLQNILLRARQINIGRFFVDIELPDPRGRQMKLSEIAGKGKYVLLDFWASWCDPCRYENIMLRTVYNEFAAKGFEIYSVSLDRRRSEWLQAISEDKLIWTNVSSLSFWDCPAVEQYGVQSIPFNVLIGPNGIIVDKNLRGAALYSRLKSLLE